MSLQNKLRSCDVFGVPVSLKLDGSTNFTTSCGGIISILLKILITAYFCMQLLALVNYSDPSISSYTLLDTRESMEEPINLQSYGV